MGFFVGKLRRLCDLARNNSGFGEELSLAKTLRRYGSEESLLNVFVKSSLTLRLCGLARENPIRGKRIFSRKGAKAPRLGKLDKGIFVIGLL